MFLNIKSLIFLLKEIEKIISFNWRKLSVCSNIYKFKFNGFKTALNEIQHTLINILLTSFLNNFHANT